MYGTEDYGYYKEERAVVPNLEEFQPNDYLRVTVFP